MMLFKITPMQVIGILLFRNNLTLLMIHLAVTETLKALVEIKKEKGV